jgi:hypothetical protein
MTPGATIVEAAGWAASAVLVAAFWTTGDRRLVWGLLCGLSLLAVHQAGIGARTAAVGSVLGILRMATALVWPRSLALTLAFCAAGLVSASLTWDGAASLLAAVGGIATTLCLHAFAGRRLRLSLLPGNAVWIAHHLVVGSAPALALEIAIMAGNAATAWRLSFRDRRTPR